MQYATLLLQLPIFLYTVVCTVQAHYPHILYKPSLPPYYSYLPFFTYNLVKAAVKISAGSMWVALMN